jgi:hypothetical protein
MAACASTEIRAKAGRPINGLLPIRRRRGYNGGRNRTSWNELLRNRKRFRPAVSLPPLPSRRLALAEIVLIFGVFAVQGAWPAPDVNETHYLGKVIHYWNPDWVRGDPFMESPNPHKVFCWTFGWLSLWFSPTALAWTGRALAWAGLAWAWRRLSWAVAPRPWCSVLTAALFGCLVQRCHMAGEWVIGGAEAKPLAYVFVFLGVESLVRDRWNRAFVWFGAACAFHVLVGGWAAMAAGIAWLLCPCPKGERIQRLRLLWPGVLAGALLSLPGLVPGVALDWGADRATAQAAHYVYVFERLPHHLTLGGIRPDFILRLTLLGLFWLWLGRLVPSPFGRGAGGEGLEQGERTQEAASGPSALTLALSQRERGLFAESLSQRERGLFAEERRRLRGFVAGAIAIALAGAVINALAMVDRPLAADWLRYYWFRLADVALPLGVALEGVALAMRRQNSRGLTAPGMDCETCRNDRGLLAPGYSCRSRFSPSAMALAILVAAYHVGDCGLDRLTVSVPRSHRIADYDSWRAACDWVVHSGAVPRDAKFLVPRHAQTFKWYTGHSDVAVWKDEPQDAESLMQWWRRIEDIYGVKGDSPAFVGTKRGTIAPGRPGGPRWHNSLAEEGASRLRQLGEKYHADLLIAERTDRLLELPVAYQNDGYVIYELCSRRRQDCEAASGCP